MRKISIDDYTACSRHHSQTAYISPSKQVTSAGRKGEGRKAAAASKEMLAW